MIVNLSNKEVNKIVFNYYLKEFADPRQAMAEYKKINTLLANGVGQL